MYTVQLSNIHIIYTKKIVYTKKIATAEFMFLLDLCEMDKVIPGKAVRELTIFRREKSSPKSWVCSIR